MVATATEPGRDYTGLGIVGMIVGVLILGGSKWLSRWYGDYRRAYASAVESVLPERGRGVASAWLRVGASESVATRRYRRLAFIAVGMAIFFIGLAATLGAWDLPPRRDPT